MAKKKSGVSTVARAARKRRARTNPAEEVGMAPNPAFGVDFTNYIVPGFAGYALARVVGRMAFKALTKKNPAAAQLAGPFASAAVTGGLYAYSHFFRPEHMQSPMFHSAIVGASIATVQSTIQAAMPGLGWVVGDYHHNDVLVPAGAKLVPADAKVASMNGSSSNGSDDLDMKALLDNSDMLGDGSDDDLGSMMDEFNQGIFAA